MANLPPALPDLTYTQLVDNTIGYYASQLGVIPQLTTGDPVLALIQGVCSQIVYLEGVIQQLANVTRAQTSVGGDLDTWMAQFAFTRIQATFAQGAVTLSVLSAHNTTAMVAVGTIVQTSGGAIQYQVIADTTQPTFNSVLNAYVLPGGSFSMTATVQAMTAGSGSIVQAGQLNSFAVQPSGIDQVSNLLAIANGLDAETDTAFRSRFALYIQGLSKATLYAIEAAIEGVQQGVTYLVMNNTNNTFGYQPGMFLAVVNDGSGNPPSTFINAVSAAIGSVVALTVQWNVIGPTPITGTIALAVSLITGYTLTQVALLVQNAVAAYVSSISFGGTVMVSGVISAATGVLGVASVKPGVTINGGVIDFKTTGVDVFVCPAASVTVTQYTP